MGRRQAILNPPEGWIVEEVPELRIVDEVLWKRVKTRQERVRANIVEADKVRSERARRPKYLFSGLIKCGVCTGGYVLNGKTHYTCANVRNRGTCQNKLTIRRDILEETVLSGLRDNLLHPDLISQYVAEWQREWNRLRREEEIVRSRDAAELATVERQITNLIAAIKQGLFSPSMKSELDSLEVRKADLVAVTATTADAVPRLHPGLANLYRKEVEALTTLLNDDARREEAVNSLRSMLEEIRLFPKDEQLEIELVGEIAGILALTNGKGPGVSTGASPTLVAGTRNARYLNLSEAWF